MLESAAFEVVPETRQARPLTFELRHPIGGVGRGGLGISELLLDSLAAGKLPAVVLGQMLTTFPIFLLTGQVRNHLLDQLAARLPQPPELVEHERGITGLGHPQPRLEGVEHLLDALRRALLLLDSLLQTIDLVLQAAVSLLELGPVAEQREDAILRGRRRFLAKVELEKS
jgi:hypothetical protein